MKGFFCSNTIDHKALIRDPENLGGIGARGAPLSSWPRGLNSPMYPNTDQKFYNWNSTQPNAVRGFTPPPSGGERFTFPSRGRYSSPGYPGAPNGNPSWTGKRFEFASPFYF